MMRAYHLQKKLATRVAVPLALTFMIVGSVFFNYLAQDLSVEQIWKVLSWHFLLSSAPFSVVIMLVWYVQLRDFLADAAEGKTRAIQPQGWVAWLGIVLQLLNAVVSVMFIIGAATTWFTSIGSASDPVRIYTIVIGAVGFFAFALSGGFGIWVQMKVRRMARDQYGAGDDDDDEADPTGYERPRGPPPNNLGRSAAYNANGGY